MAGNINCPFCGGSVAEHAETCSYCGGPLKKASVAPPANPLKTTRCPNCNGQVNPGDIVCVACGTNLLTGQKVAEERKAPPAKASINMAATLKWVSITLVALVIVGISVLFVLYLLRDPVGDALNLARAGNLTQAADALQSYLENNPDKVEAQFLLGKIYWQGQQYAKASETFTAVARKGGSQARDALLFALLAEEELKNPADNQREKQLALMNSLVRERFPNDGDLLKMLALLQGVGGDHKGLRRSMEEAALSGSELPPALPALAYALDGDLGALERFIEKRGAAQGPDLEAQAVLGFARLAGGQEELGAAALSGMAPVSPEIDGWIKLQQGILHMRHGEYGKALPLLSDAKRLQPENERTAFLHALCLQENKLTEEALSAYESILAAKGAHAGHAALQMALLHAEQGNLDRAAALAREAADAGLTTARQATIQGRIFSMQGDAAQAEQAYRRAMAMTAEYPAAHLELGLLLVNRGAMDEGLQQLDHYLELAKADPVALRANEIEVLVTQIRQTQQ